jgi:hypothetical protein
MREPLRRLARDDWVVGIAAAIAIGYAVVAFVRSVAEVVLDVVAGEEYEGPLAVGGVRYDGLATSAATLLAVVVLAAFALRRARGNER